MAGDFGTALAVGPVTLPNRVFLAPMSASPTRRSAVSWHASAPES
jgi:2,4-dienoyl-CoA reductase-like NADH-dependent reductase (Old Yellow Enzyme family)